MFFAENFAKKIVIGNTKIPVKIIVEIIRSKLEEVSSGNKRDVAIAAPVLVLLIEYKVMNESPITIVFIAPNVKRNSLWSICFPKNSLPINAACAAPRPGRNAVNGAAIIEAVEDFNIVFFESRIFVSFVFFCSGI